MAKSTVEPGPASLVGQGGDIRLLIHQRGSLIKTTAYLVQCWKSASDDASKSYLAIAATLTAHAATEAILNEWAHDTDATLYKQTRNAGLVKRADKLCNVIGESPPTDLANLSEAKNSVGHSEPDNSRSGRVGNWIAGKGAERALAVVLECEHMFFPAGMARPKSSGFSPK